MTRHVPFVSPVVKELTAIEVREGRFGPSARRTMMSFPVLSGDHLRDLVGGYGGRARVCEDFQISRELLDIYLSRQAEPPLSLLLAIYWQGPSGFNHAFAESDAVNLHNFGMRRLAEEKADKVLSMVDRIVAKLGSDHQVAKLLSMASEKALAGLPLWHKNSLMADPSRAGESPEVLRRSGRC